jgi:hypothetical protein
MEERTMKRMMLLPAVVFFMAAGLMTLPLTAVKAQTWKSITVTYLDIKDKGKFTAQYKVVPQKKGCIMTVRLTNKTDEDIPGYWFKFTFKEGGLHESRHPDHLAGTSADWDYGKCGLKSVEISEVE